MTTKSSGEARQEAFERWWSFPIARPELRKELAREAYYAAWGDGSNRWLPIETLYERYAFSNDPNWVPVVLGWDGRNKRMRASQANRFNTLTKKFQTELPESSGSNPDAYKTPSHWMPLPEMPE